MHGHPGAYMVRQAERALPTNVRNRISNKAEATIGNLLGLGYGVAFGAAYAALRRGRPRSVIGEGVALGLVNWLVGYAGWLPATGLTDKPWQHRPHQIAVSVLLAVHSKTQEMAAAIAEI